MQVKPRSEWTLGERLERALYDAGYSQRAAAKELGIGRNTLNEIILGKRGARLDTWLKLSELARKPLSEIVQPEEWRKAIEAAAARIKH